MFGNTDRWQNVFEPGYLIRARTMKVSLDVGQRPPEHTARAANAGTDIVDEWARQAVHDRIGKHESRRNIAVASPGQRHGRLEIRGGDSDRQDLTIQVIDDGGAEGITDHQPVLAGRARLRGWPIAGRDSLIADECRHVRIGLEQFGSRSGCLLLSPRFALSSPLRGWLRLRCRLQSAGSGQ